MVAASGPTGILAGRPSESPSQTAAPRGSSSPRNAANHGVFDERKDAAAAARHESDLYVRPSWTDAAIALDQLEKVPSYCRRAHASARALSLSLCAISFFPSFAPDVRQQSRSVSSHGFSDTQLFSSRLLPSHLRLLFARADSESSSLFAISLLQRPRFCDSTQSTREPNLSPASEPSARIAPERECQPSAPGQSANRSLPPLCTSFFAPNNRAQSFRLVSHIQRGQRLRIKFNFRLFSTLIKRSRLSPTCACDCRAVLGIPSGSNFLF